MMDAEVSNEYEWHKIDGIDRFLVDSVLLSCVFFFFFNDTATTEIYTLSLHDALPIYGTPTLLVPHMRQLCH